MAQKTYYKPRQIGRVSDEVWDQLKRGAERSGRSFSQWSVGILYEAAIRYGDGYDFKDASGEHQQRVLGRICDEHWETLTAAAYASGRTFTEWAVGLLMHAAKHKHPGFDYKGPD